MAQEEWKRTQITESGNYPKQSFKGVLAAIYPTVTDSGIPVLQLDFEDGRTYNMPTSNKDGTKYVHESGEVDVYPLNEFLKSIENISKEDGKPIPFDQIAVDARERVKDELGIKTFWAFVDGNPTGFKTEPDIIGKTLHNVARPRQVGDATQTSKYPDWTIGQVDGLTAQPAKKKGGYPEVRKPGRPAKEQPPAQVSQELSDALLEADVVGQNISEVFNETFKKKYRVPEIRAALATIGLEVAQNGIIQKQAV